MKKKYILKRLLVTIFLTFIVTGCDGYDVELFDKLDLKRVFAPIGLTTIVRNQTTVELNWTVRQDVDHYVVEVSADDTEFSTIFKTIDVTSDQLPLQIALEGETIYSIRVKAISASGLEDSKWSIVTATTLSEQLFIAAVDGDIQAKQVIIRWVPSSNVTHVVFSPGDIKHTITDEEKTNGIAIVTGLTAETQYSAILFNNTKKRGFLTLTTGIDIGTGTLVKTTDDLFQKIADANSGDILVLQAGDYSAQTGTITLSKSITIRGLRSYDKPVLKVSFSLVAGATEVNLIDLDLNGGKTLIDVIRYSETGNYTSLLISGCTIHDYARSFIAANVSSAKVNSVIVDNCVVTNVVTNGGDFIDFRNTYVADISVKNSTFNNCATSREFFRIDAASGLSGTGLATNVLLDSCTLYGVCNSSGKRILYVRFNANILTIRNTLFAETVAVYSNQTSTSEPTFLNNNYFNAPGLFDPTVVKYDKSTNYTTLNPEFVSASTGNFTIKNQTLLDNKIGDPRWRK